MHTITVLFLFAFADWSLLPEEPPTCWELVSSPVSQSPPQELGPVFGHQVDAYTPRWCSVCKTIPRYSDWRFIRNESEFPQWVLDKADKDGYPVLHYKRDGEWRCISGWNGADWLRDVLDGPDEPEESTQRLAQAEPSPGYPIRGRWWSHPGNVRRHLIQDHGYSAEYVRSLSHAEAESLHSDTHEGRVSQPATRSRPARVYNSPRYCPTCR